MMCAIGMLMLMAPMALLAADRESPARSVERLFEWTVESRKSYADPFNEVDVDVVFERGAQTWRVPTFWRGGNRWTVRFAPPVAGEYSYHLESSDRSNPDLNGHTGKVRITSYGGPNPVLRHGMLRVSTNKRSFEYADGTPFYWLGDTWWMGLSSLLDWDGFKSLALDRKEKGFTVVQIVAGFVPYKAAPGARGFSNEGGGVWRDDFSAINPAYFDYADRRISYLIDHGMVPAIFGSWYDAFQKLSVKKMEKHWRYIIARYGAFPVFWVLGGEVYDPPNPPVGDDALRMAKGYGSDYPWFLQSLGQWSEVAKYIRQTDPYGHLLTVHEWNPDEQPLQRESLTDFQLLQPAHYGWPSIAVEVARVGLLYARQDVTKPIVVGEVGYEGWGDNSARYERVAFWLGMLNGASGFSYGAGSLTSGVIARSGYAGRTWQEDMHLPGSYQIGLGAKLLQQYRWWEFTPHPEWIIPRGTTLLEPRRGDPQSFHMDLLAEWNRKMGLEPPQSEWARRNGNFDLPYAAGIPGQTRIIYFPQRGLASLNRKERAPTVLGLEPGVRYRTYYWAPSLGTKIDLGTVERPAPGVVLFEDRLETAHADAWMDVRGGGAVVKQIDQKNLVASVSVRGSSDIGLILRYHDDENFIGAFYSSQKKTIYLVDKRTGSEEVRLGETSVPSAADSLTLRAETRDGLAIASISDGAHTYCTPIVDVVNKTSGRAGLLRQMGSGPQSVRDFSILSSTALVADAPFDRKLYDARGQFRGELNGVWSNYGLTKDLLLDAYRPPNPPDLNDWLLVMDASTSESARP